MSDATISATELARAIYRLTDVLPEPEPLRIKLREVALDIVAEISRDASLSIQAMSRLLRVAEAQGFAREENFALLGRAYGELQDLERREKATKRSFGADDRREDAAEPVGTESFAADRVASSVVPPSSAPPLRAGASSVVPPSSAPPSPARSAPGSPDKSLMDLSYLRAGASSVVPPSSAPPLRAGASSVVPPSSAPPLRAGASSLEGRSLVGAALQTGLREVEQIERHKSLTEWDGMSNGIKAKALNVRQKKIIGHFHYRQAFQLRDARALFEGYSQKTLRNDLRDLCLKGILNREGVGTASFYRVAVKMPN